MNAPLHERARKSDNSVGYEKPSIERLGTFRELTQSGGLAFTDQWITDGTDGGCQLNGSASYTCVKP